MATGATVGTTDIQTLTNKRIDGAKNTLTNVPLSALPSPGGVTAQVTANVGSITTTDVVLVTAPAVTGDGIKRFKITASFEYVTSTAGDRYIAKIKAGGVQIKDGLLTCVTASSDSFTLVTTHVPATGACVYTLTVYRWQGTGTGLVSGWASAPIEIIVERIA